MVDYINKLGKIRTGWGKDYLVYGQMVRSPQIGTGKTEYEFFNSNIRPWCETPYLGGKHSLNDVVVSAYKTFDGRTAIFLANVSQKDVPVKFVLNALRDYGIEKGDVYMTSPSGKKGKVASVNNGKANISYTLDVGEVCMLELR